MNATAKMLLDQEREPAFDLVQPGGARRREVHVIARRLRQPAVNERRLVRGVVVEDQVHRQVGRHGSGDGVEEFAKLDRAMVAMTLADHCAGLHVERGKQRRRAVARVVVRAPLDLLGAHRQQGLRAIERLDLRFLVYTEDERVLCRIEVEPDDVPDFVDEEGIPRELECLRASRARGLPARRSAGVPGSRAASARSSVVMGSGGVDTTVKAGCSAGSASGSPPITCWCSAALGHEPRGASAGPP
jgi:hypothetical protein